MSVDPFAAPAPLQSFLIAIGRSDSDKPLPPLRMDRGAITPGYPGLTYICVDVIECTDGTGDNRRA